MNSRRETRIIQTIRYILDLPQCEERNPGIFDVDIVHPDFPDEKEHYLITKYSTSLSKKERNVKIYVEVINLKTLARASICDYYAHDEKEIFHFH